MNGKGPLQITGLDFCSPSGRCGHVISAFAGQRQNCGSAPCSQPAIYLGTWIIIMHALLLVNILTFLTHWATLIIELIIILHMNKVITRVLYKLHGKDDKFHWLVTTKMGRGTDCDNLMGKVIKPTINSFIIQAMILRPFYLFSC